MRSPTQRAFSARDVAAAVRVAFGPDAALASAAELTGGSFGTLWRADLVDGRQTVLKVGPDPRARLLTYEAGMLGAEADYLRLVAARAPGVPVPRLLWQGPDWLFMTLVPGEPLHTLPEDVDTDPVRFAAGSAIARLHGVTGDRYGYPGDRPHADNWPDAYAAMLGALLDDAVAWRVELPVPAEQLRAVVERHRPLLATVTTPALLHFDLWDGNVLATVRDGVAELGGLVDGERYLFGDPMIDFASPWLFRDILATPEHPFVRGYTAVRRFETNDNLRRRYAFAQLYLYLVMIVEFPSRGMTPESEQWRWETLRALVRELVTGLG